MYAFSPHFASTYTFKRFSSFFPPQEKPQKITFCSFAVEVFRIIQASSRSTPLGQPLWPNRRKSHKTEVWKIIWDPASAAKSYGVDSWVSLSLGLPFKVILLQPPSQAFSNSSGSLSQSKTPLHRPALSSSALLANLLWYHPPNPEYPQDPKTRAPPP